MEKKGCELFVTDILRLCFSDHCPFVTTLNSLICPIYTAAFLPHVLVLYLVYG